MNPRTMTVVAEIMLYACVFFCIGVQFSRGSWVLQPWFTMQTLFGSLALAVRAGRSMLWDDIEKEEDKEQELKKNK